MAQNMREKSNPKLGWRKTLVRNQGKIELLTIRTALSRTRVQNRFPTIRGWNFVHEIASRQPADGISRTKLLPDNSRTEFRARNCSFGLLDKILLSRIHLTDKARPTSPLIAVQTVAGRRGSRPLKRSEAVDYRTISFAVCVCIPSP